MRKLPTVLAAGFIIITLWRVGQFAETRMVAGWLGWIFASVLGAALYVASYWTRDSISAKEVIKDGKTVDKQDRRAVSVKRWAIGVMVLLIVVDGLFNVAEVWQSVNPPAFGVNPLLVIATATYGAFPTLIVALLGALQGHIDRLPKPPKPASKMQGDGNISLVDASRALLLAMLAQWKENVTQPKASPVQVNALTAPQRKVYDAIKRNPSASHGDISKVVKLSRQRVGQVVKELEAGGHIHKNGKTEKAVA